MKSGLYALASLDGGPLDPLDRAVLELDGSDGADVSTSDGFAVRAVEAGVHRNAVHVRAGNGITVLLGHFDEPEDLAARLGLDRRVDALALARAALERFGHDAPREMLGEWSLLHWCDRDRTLTLVASAPQRDTLYVATDGQRVAVSPELRRLARLPWVGPELDRRGVLLVMGRARLRRDLGAQTILRRAERLRAGATIRLGPGGRRRDGLAEILIPAEPWRGGLDEAVEELELVLRRIVGQRLARLGTAAFTLSGGLDSSLLTWLGSQERRPGQDLVCLTSAAGADTGLLDEVPQARVVAHHLGLSVVPVVPDAARSPFRPSLRVLRHGESPSIGPNHFVYEALYAAALAGGAGAILDGVGGEFTVTSPTQLPDGRDPLRTAVRAARRWRHAVSSAVLHRPAWPADAFHVRPSPDALTGLSEDLEERWRQPFRTYHAPRAARPWGFAHGIAKNLNGDTTTIAPELRRWYPFFDQRLVRLFATMPAGMTERDGLTRAPARMILRRGGLPESVWRRVDKMPFSPEYRTRLRMHAPGALERVALFEAAGVGAWLDLAWLRRSLERLAVHGSRDIPDAFLVQGTALAA